LSLSIYNSTFLRAWSTDIFTNGTLTSQAIILPVSAITVPIYGTPNYAKITI